MTQKASDSQLSKNEEQILAALPNQVLRDLAWLLLSPSLFEGNLQLGADFSSEQLIPAQLHFDREDILTTLSHYQGPLPENLQQPKRRLGLYCEDLLALWFDIHPKITPLGRNIQILEPQAKGQRTLGELDFLYLDYRKINCGDFDCMEIDSKKIESEEIVNKQTDSRGVDVCEAAQNEAHKALPQLVHLELAVKYYLKHSDRFFGPNAIDRLDKKLGSMANKQLPLASSPQAQACIESILAQKDFSADERQKLLDTLRSCAYLKGQLHLPGTDNSEHAFSWLYWPEFQSTAQSLWPKYQWLGLDKAMWLSQAQLVADNSDQLLSSSEMSRWLVSYQENFLEGVLSSQPKARGLGGLKGLMSIQLMGLGPNGERIMLFLVEPQWPQTNKK